MGVRPRVDQNHLELLLDEPIDGTCGRVRLLNVTDRRWAVSRERIEPFIRPDMTRDSVDWVAWHALVSCNMAIQMSAVLRRYHLWRGAHLMQCCATEYGATVNWLDGPPSDKLAMILRDSVCGLPQTGVTVFPISPGKPQFNSLSLFATLDVIERCVAHFDMKDMWLDRSGV